MWEIVREKLLITSNERKINTNRTLTNTLLDKASFIEADIKHNKEDYDEINKLNKVLEERIEILEDDNLGLKEIVLKVSKNFMKYSSYQRQLIKDQDKKIEYLNNKLNTVLEYIENSNPIVNTNTKEILEQVEKVDEIANQIFRLKPTKKKIKNNFR